MNLNKAVFLDRDGTLNEEVSYLTRTEDLKVFDFTSAALNIFKNLGFLNIIITNQSGVARGFLSEDDLNEIHSELLKRLTVEGNCLIDGVYYSPFHPDGTVENYRINSPDRKPGTGMIQKAQTDFGIDISESYFIGDSLTDMQCAANSGLKSIMVATGYGAADYGKCLELGITPDFYANDLLEASEFIQSETQKGIIKSFS